MSITTVLTGIEALMAEIDGYSRIGKDRNITWGDYGILDKGLDKAIVLEYQESPHGPGSAPFTTHGTYTSIHKVKVAVFQQYRYSETSYKNAISDTDTIMALIAKYPKLNATSGVDKAVIVRSGKPDLGGTESSAPFWRIDLFLEVTEEVTTNAVE